MRRDAGGPRTMQPRPHWTLTGDNVKYIEGEDFQQFCRELLEFEVSRRHTDGRVDGPPERYLPDKGMDLMVRILDAPRLSKAGFAHALTADGAGTTCVACKSGSNWEKGFLNDAGKSAPSEVMAQGGRFTMIVNQQVAATKKEEVLTKIAETLSRNTSKPTGEVRAAIELLDANDLADFFTY